MVSSSPSRYFIISSSSLLGDGFDQFAAVFLSQLLHILGDLLHADILAQVIVVDVGFHLKQVDDALEGLLLADGKLQGDGVRTSGGP